MLDSLMLAADLSYLDKKRTGSAEVAVSTAARKSWANRSNIERLPSTGRFAGLLFGPCLELSLWCEDSQIKVNQ